VGQEAVQSVNGPLARSLRDLTTYCRAVVGAGPHLRDPRCLPLPWRAEDADRVRWRKLRVGVMWDDGVVRPTPPVGRALREVVGKLKAAGHEVVEWAPDGHLRMFELLVRISQPDEAGRG
jgi:amidase